VLGSFPNVTAPLDATNIELDVLAGVTPGTVAAGKAVVVDGSKDISSFNDVGIAGIATVGTVTDGTATLTGGTLSGVTIDTDGTLGDGVVATTQAADDDSTLVATTAYAKGEADAAQAAAEATAEAYTDTATGANTTGSARLVNAFTATYPTFVQVTTTPAALAAGWWMLLGAQVASRVCYIDYQVTSGVWHRGTLPVCVPMLVLSTGSNIRIAAAVTLGDYYKHAIAVGD